ncbi:putative lipoprotein [Vibrio ichthyoenteri ATCC 700023]|uniref:Putative lipoprotein n=1 Tax=Vibrio ichthyoenteri ATCC 700023 TaxID=870968 RepID=F9RXQ9_9VIBR|nr:DUF6279 family lipoprotein [Vibrio ichthyoenteri]EGU47632.1 putative lipoprotein [Vibrio ichthyoenteri ATCC 700023]
MRCWVIWLAICLSLSGCGTKLVYENLDWLTIRYVEEFVELDREQQSHLSEAINNASEWHRSDEIPAYIEELDQLLLISPDQFSLEQFYLHEERLRGFSVRLLDEFFPAITALVAKMSDEQVEQFMDTLRVRHIKFKQQKQIDDKSEWTERYQNRISENLSDWVGPLTPLQQTFVEQWASELLVTTPLWFEYQTQLRVELVNIFSHRQNTEQLPILLRQLLYTPEQFYSAELAARITHNSDIGRAYLIKIINVMTEKQTLYFRQEVQDWRDILAQIVR